MIEKISQYIVNKWVANNVITLKDKLSYYYGVQLLFSTIINFMCIIIISAFISMPYYWIAFVLAFIPFRLSAGGYHANTHLACILGFCTVFCLSGVVAKWLLCNENGRMCVITMAGFSWIVIYNKAPVIVPNKPLPDAQRSRNRTRSLYLATFYLFLALVAHISDFVFFMFCGEFVSTVLIVLQSFKQEW